MAMDEVKGKLTSIANKLRSLATDVRSMTDKKN